MSIRVVVADDHGIVRLGLVKLLELIAGVVVVGEVDDGAYLLDVVRSAAPDVLLLDIVMPRLDVVAQVRQLAQLEHRPRVLILTGHGSDEFVQPLVAAGISGYLLKDEIPDTIAQAIRTVARGEMWFSQRIAGLIVRSTYAAAPDDEPADSALGLTPREWEILQQIGQGKNNSDIAEELALSKATVQNYVSNIYTKLGIETRAQAIIYAMRNKLVDLKEMMAEG